MEGRGSISFFATYRPPVPLDIYSSTMSPNSADDELDMTDGEASYYNGYVIPPTALKKMLKRPKLASVGTEADVDAGRLIGLLCVSERTKNLETLHISLRLNNNKPKVFNFAEVYNTYDKPRLEDSGCIAGDYLIYVSTRDPADAHQPWTAVFKTHLVTGKTERLTPQEYADLSPSVSPNGKMIAVASFQGKEGGWLGDIEDLRTNIFVLDLEKPTERKLVVKDGGWPTWGSDNVLFFHRNIEKKNIVKRWGVYRIDLRNGLNSETRVTPEDISAITPAAIDDTKVVVATIRKNSKFGDVREKEQYRHIEIFDSTKPNKAIEITQKIRVLADHFNPFIVEGKKGEKRIGYHRCNVRRTKTVKTAGHKLQTTTEDVKDEIDAFTVVETQFHEIECPDPDLGLFRVAGVFPTFSPDGTKLAFVDNEFKAVWVADNDGLRKVYEKDGPDSLFSPVWNQNPKKDLLYVCVGHSFQAKTEVHICAIQVAARGNQRPKRLTQAFNNAFPATDPKGERIVYRSTRDHQIGNDRFKNLYIMDAEEGEYGEGEGDGEDEVEIMRLTNGKWVDTHCQWSPRGDWIVFSSNRDMPPGTIKPDDLPDAGYFAVYLVNPNDPNKTCIKVIDSGMDITRNLPFAGHVNHPYFSPDGTSIVVASDLAAISCDPISLPLFSHSVRPYGDIFTVELDIDDIKNNENLTEFNRITHSRYEASTATWTKFSTKNTAAKWNDFLKKRQGASPYLDPRGGESFLLTGHLCIMNRCC